MVGGELARVQNDHHRQALALRSSESVMDQSKRREAEEGSAREGQTQRADRKDGHRDPKHTARAVRYEGSVRLAESQGAERDPQRQLARVVANPSRFQFL